MKSIGVVIPAFNVECVIKQVIKKVACYIPKKYIVVINDGSTDKTAERARETGVIVLEHQRRCGKGVALQTGFKWLLNKQLKAVITMDGDGQHDAEAIPHFIQKAQATQYDIIIGSRMHQKKDIPVMRLFTNQASSLVISWLIKQSIPDTQSGFRFIKSKVLQSIKLTSRYYNIESEVLLKAALAGFSIGVIPVRAIYLKNQKSNFRLIRDSLIIIGTILKGFFWRWENN